MREHALPTKLLGPQHPHILHTIHYDIISWNSILSHWWHLENPETVHISPVWEPPLQPTCILWAVSRFSQQTNVLTLGKMPKGVWREMFKAPASHTNENPLLSHSNTHTHQHILIQCTSIWLQTPPLSPMPQCLPITKEVINSTTAPSREIDFNDTSYMAAVSVPDSHLHTGRDPASRLSAALHCKA